MVYLSATSHMGALTDDPVKLMEDYSRNCKLMFYRRGNYHMLTLRYYVASYLINLSQAVGRLILTGRDLTRFAGYTVNESLPMASALYSLIRVLVSSCRFV